MHATHMNGILNSTSKWPIHIATSQYQLQLLILWLYTGSGSEGEFCNCIGYEKQKSKLINVQPVAWSIYIACWLRNQLQYHVYSYDHSVMIRSVASCMGTDKKIAIRNIMHGKAAAIEFPSGNGCMHTAGYSYVMNKSDYVSK